MPKARGATNLKCPFCGRVCTDQDFLMVHIEEYHKDTDDTSGAMIMPRKKNNLEEEKVPDQPPKKAKTVKCTVCFKRL